MRDFTDDLRECVAGSTRRPSTSRSLTAATGSIELEAEMAAPTCGTTPDGPSRSAPSTPTSRPTSTSTTSSSQQLDDAEVLHELAREVDDETQEPEIDAAVTVDRRSSSTSSSCAACSPASTTTPTCIVQINAKDGGVDAQD